MLRPDFIYKRKSRNNIPFKTSKPAFANEPEQLSGTVNGMSASDLEERFHKASKQSGKVRNEYFRLSVGGARGEPGWLELDYLLETNFGWRAFEIDDVSFVHKGQGEVEEAREKDIRRVEGLKQMGIELSPSHSGKFIEHVTNEDLGTQADANYWVKENL